MSDFYSDLFAGTGPTAISNDTLLSTHVPFVGAGYDNSGGGDPKFDGNNRLKAGTAAAICLVTATPPSPDYTALFKVKHLDFAADQNWHIMVRVSGSDRYALVFSAFASTPYLALAKSIGGVVTELQTLNWTPTVGQEYTFELKVVGTALTVYRDSVSILTGTASDLSAAGSVAIVLQGASTGSTGLRFTYGQAISGTTIFYQDYLETPGTLLSAHTPNTGTGYSNSLGGDPELDGSGRARSGRAAGISLANATYPGADYTVEFRVKHLDFAADQNWHIVGRCSSGGDRYGLVFGAFLSTPRLALSKSVSSTVTDLVTLDWTPTPGQEYIFQLVLAGSTIKAYRDGTQILTTTDSSISATGKLGVVVQGARTSSTGLRMYAGRAFAPAAATIFTAVVPVNGGSVDLTFDGAASGLTLNDFVVSSGGVNMKLTALTGSGAAYSLKLESYIEKVVAVKVTYLGSSISPVTVTATNNSTTRKEVIRLRALGQGTFIHFSAATWGLSGTVTQATMNSVFNPTSLNIDQWLDACVAMGSRYAVFTTKHDQGFCMWPTTSGTINSSATPWGVSTGIDIVGQFVSKCRARGLKVGLYINFYDPWYTGVRTGHDGTYTPPSTFTAYMGQQITELLSNYGAIDILWLDSWAYRVEIGYVNADYTTLHNLITTLQPNCIVINNNSETDLSHTELYSLEGPPSLPPDSSNLLPAEFHMTATADDDWVWNSTNAGACKDPKVIAQTLALCKAGKTNLLINLPPDTTGVFPSATVAFASAYGAVVGRQGGDLLPVPGNVKKNVDRGDGVLGSLISGPAIYGG